MSERTERRRHLLLATCWAALALAGLFGVRGTDHLEFSQAVDALSTLRGEQAELDRALLHVRVDEESDPGALGPVLAKLEKAEHRSLDVLLAARDADLARDAEAYSAALRVSSGIVTRYATLCTMWRAEMRAWQEAQPPGSAGEALPEALDAARLARVKKLEADMSACLAELEEQRLPARSEQLLSAYSRWYGSRLAIAEIFRVGLFVLSGLLILHLLRRARLLSARIDELERGPAASAEPARAAPPADRDRQMEESTKRVLDEVLAEAREEDLAAQKAEEAQRQALANKPRPAYVAPKPSDEAEYPLLPPDENLMQLVGDAIAREKLVACALRIEHSQCAPGDIVGDVYHALVRKANERGIELSVVWETKVPARVRTDPFRLEQVLKILVGNAIKFTQRGRVTVSVAYELPTEPEGSACLCFTIQDTGVGMDEKELARLTEGKNHADGAGGKDQYGSGQGLSLCMHLVELLGGSIWVRSKKRHGSVFVFRVEAGVLDSPLEHAELGRTRPEEWLSGDAATYLDGVRVLLTESGDDVDRLARHFLVRAGANVTCASDGAEAVRRVLLAETEGEPFDAVLMDMEMPIVDGYEATRRLRASGYVRAIVALSGSTLTSDAEACRTAGCDDYCSKPLRSSTLLETVARWAHDGANSGQRPAAPVPPAPLPAKVPDADEELLELVRAFLGELEADVAEMRDALAKPDLTRVATLAHRLKGAAGSYGFPEITRQAEDVESAVQAQFSTADIGEEIEALATLCRNAAAEHRAGAQPAGSAAPSPTAPAKPSAASEAPAADAPAKKPDAGA